MRPVVVVPSFSTTARCAGCSMYSPSPDLSVKRAKRAWVYPPDLPEKSSPTERSMVLGTSSLTAKNTRWSTMALPLATVPAAKSLADDRGRQPEDVELGPVPYG